jgi:F0F1-type ATP synthase assembly protein I
MPSVPAHSGEMSQDSEPPRGHPSAVNADAPSPPDALPAPQGLTPALDPAARRSRQMFDGLSASSAGLELGIAVAIGALFGVWLDGRLGTAPWMMIAFLVIGLIAGFRGVLHAVARAERAARRD